MKQNRNIVNAFTLIEMLIVVVIIGILAAALIPRLQGAQERARDIKRKADLKEISYALQIYFADNQIYPLPPGGTIGSCCDTATSYDYPTNYILGLAPHYISLLPIDPLNKVTNYGGGTYITGNGETYIDGNYVYEYGRVMKDPNSYDLIAQLENKKDPDRCEIKHYKLRMDKRVRCDNPNLPYSKQIYQYFENSWKKN